MIGTTDDLKRLLTEHEISYVTNAEYFKSVQHVRKEHTCLVCRAKIKIGSSDLTKSILISGKGIVNGALTDTHYHFSIVVCSHGCLCELSSLLHSYSLDALRRALHRIKKDSTTQMKLFQ